MFLSSSSLASINSLTPGLQKTNIRIERQNSQVVKSAPILFEGIMQNQQKQAELDLVCIRHGESKFNKGESSFFSEHPGVDHSQAERLQEFRESILYAIDNIDTELTSQGVQQCLRARKDSSLSLVELVVVSPLTRALQTANLIFPQPHIPKIVHPELSQCFGYSCDLSHPIQQKKERFPSFDFSMMKDFSPHWYITNNLGESNLRILKECLERSPGNSFCQQKKICEFLRFGKISETGLQLRERTGRMRGKIRQYRKCYRKIAVVSHETTLRYLINEEFDIQSNPATNMVIENAKPYWLSLVKLGMRR